MYAQKIKQIARFIVGEGATVRLAADVFGISKSTVHTYVTQRLKSIDLELYEEVQKVLKNNKAEWHIRGGMATRERWRVRKMKENN